MHGKNSDTLQAKMVRTWHVRVAEKSKDDMAEDDDDQPMFDLFA